MEIDNFKENLKLSRKQRELKHWTKRYDIALKNFETAPIIDDEHRIEEIRSHRENFKEKYPFYAVLLNLIETESNKDSLRSRIVQEIISYLEIAHQKGGEFFIKKGNYLYKSKKIYSTEIKSIRKDLNAMLYYAFTINDFQQKTTSKIDSITKKELIKVPKIPYKKPGRKPFSENDLVALKYLIIHKFYISEMPLHPDSNFESIGDFQTKISEKENVNKHSFKNSFNKIADENLEAFCKKNPQLIKQLKQSKALINYPKCIEFINRFATD